MFDSLRHQILDQGPFHGEIQSHEGDIYIARLFDVNGKLLETNDQHFSSLVRARKWLKHQGASSIDFDPSTAYFEMINND